mgnify:CR=1 FL=1
MTEFLLVVLLGLVVARATRLWRDDAITEGLRSWAEGALTDSITTTYRRGDRLREWANDLLGCPWCLSGWLSILAVAVVDSATSRSVPAPFLIWLAVWQVSNLAYWLTELVADRDALAWAERENKGLA